MQPGGGAGNLDGGAGNQAVVEGLVGSQAGRRRRLSSVNTYDDPLDDDTITHLAFTNNDPMGKLLLQVVKDNIDLRRQAGMAGTNINVSDFCQAFYTKAQVDKNQLDGKFQQAEADIRARIVRNKISSHDELTSHPHPSYFSPQDTLHNATAQAHSMKLFPMGSGKFSGYKGKDNEGGVGVVEFLSSLNRAQEVAKLSEAEFKNQMLNSTTGKAHSLLVDWFSNGEGIPEVFFNLITYFDRRVSVEESRAKLASYKAQKGSNLAKVEADLMTMAARACTTLPPGPSRQACYNMESTGALIRALPPTSSAVASNTFHLVSSELGRAATFTELSRALNVYRHTIDTDIKANGMHTKDKVMPQAGQGAVKKQWGKRMVKATTYGISGAQNDGNVTKQSKAHNPQAGGRQGPNQPNTAWNTGSQSRGQYGHSFSNTGNGNGSNGQQNQRGGNHGQRSRGRGRGSWRGNNRQNGATQATYCSLCGNTDHTALQGCPFMVNDQGQRINYQPTQGVCGACPPCIAPRLNHSERICPYRKGGPLHGTAL